MHLRSLTVSNIRSIRQLTIGLADGQGRPIRRKVLAGPNGCGKTTVLDAVTHLFGLLDDRLGASLLGADALPSGAGPLRGMIEADLVPQPARPAEHGNVVASVPRTARTEQEELEDQRQPTVALLGGADRTAYSAETWSALGKLHNLASLVRNSVGAPCLLLPADRGTLRVPPGLQVQTLKRLVPAHESLRTARERFDTVAVLLHLARIAPGQFDPDGRVERLWSVVGEYFPELPQPERAPALVPLYSFRGSRPLRADELSSGQGALLLMLGEVALRDPADGIVLIDEVEQHLHPRWATRVLEALGALSPSTQFIVTTHSPVVYGSVPEEDRMLLAPWD